MSRAVSGIPQQGSALDFVRLNPPPPPEMSTIGPWPGSSPASSRLRPPPLVPSADAKTIDVNSQSTACGTDGDWRACYHPPESLGRDEALTIRIRMPYEPVGNWYATWCTKPSRGGLCDGRGNSPGPIEKRFSRNAWLSYSPNYNSANDTYWIVAEVWECNKTLCTWRTDDYSEVEFHYFEIRLQDAPDLTVPTFGIDDSPRSVAAGERIRLEAIVRNDGQGQSSPTTLDYRRSSDSRITSEDAYLASDQVPALDPGGATPESTSVDAPSNPGIYYYGACVESVQGESNTANNCSTGYRLEVRSPEYYAGISSVSFRNPNVQAGSGEDAQPTATMRNEGDVGTYRVRIEVLDAGRGDRVVASQTFSNVELDPGEPRTESMRWAPGTNDTSTYKVRATALTVQGDPARTRRLQNPRVSEEVSFGQRPTIARVEPASPSVTVEVNQYLRFEARASDADEDIDYVEFSTSGNAELRRTVISRLLPNPVRNDCQITCGDHSHDAEYRWPTPGTYQVTANVVDDRGAESSITWTVTVEAAEAQFYAGASSALFRNPDATIGSGESALPGATVVNEGDTGTFRLRIEVVVADRPDEVIYSRTSRNFELEAGKARKFTGRWEPSRSDTGAYRVRATVLTIHGNPVRTRELENPRLSQDAVTFNSPPSIAVLEPTAGRPVRVERNEYQRFEVRGQDVDGNIEFVQFSAQGEPDSNDGEFNRCHFGCDDAGDHVQYRWARAGTYPVAARVVDKNGAEARVRWSVTVAEDNSPPTVERVEPRRAAVPIRDRDEFIRFEVLAKDADADSRKQISQIVFEATGGPEIRGSASRGCSGDCDRWRHNVEYRWRQAGPHYVTAEVVDGTGARSETSWVVDGRSRQYDLGSEIGVEDVLFNADELGDFIEEQADHLDGKLHVVQGLPACRLLCRSPKKEDRTTYMRILSSKALISFVRVQNDLPAAVDSKNPEHVEAMQAYVENLSRLEQVFIRLLVEITAHVDMYGLSTPPVDFELAAMDSGNNLYFAMTAYRLLHQSSASDAYDDLYSDAELRIANEFRDRGEREAAYEWLADLALTTLHAEFLRTPKIPESNTLDELVDDTNGRLIKRARQMVGDLLTGGPGGALDLWTSGLNHPIGGVAGLVSDVDFVLNVADFLDDAAPELLRIGVNAAEFKDGAVCEGFSTHSCLGAEKRGPWKAYVWEQDCPDSGCLTFVVPPEAHARLEAIEARIEELRAKGDGTEEEETEREQGTVMRTLWVTKAGTGSVHSANRGGIACGTDCQHRYKDTTLVELSAVAHEGWQFSGWRGVCSGDGSCVVRMDADKRVSATFTRVPGNQPPVWQELGAFPLAVGETSTLKLQATDADGDELDYSLHTRGPTLAGDTLSWTPTDSETGSHVLKVGVRDGFNDPVYKVVSVYVQPRENLPPAISPVVPLSVQPGETVTFPVAVSDPNPQDSVQVSIRSGTAPPGSVLRDGTFTWAVDSGDTGRHAVTFEASDGQSLTSQTVVIEVTTANRPPVLVPVGLQTAASGERVSFAVIATDADNDPVTVRAQTLPAGASFDGRVFAWTTPTSFTGERVVAFIASDDDPTSADAEMAVRISVVAGATHRLAVSRQGEGRIWSLPGGIDCGADCTHTYDENATVTLRAVPAAEHRFAGWTGCTADVSDSTSCTVAMTASIQVAARFSSGSTDTPPPAPETLYSYSFESQGVGRLPDGYVTVFNGSGDAEQRVEEEGGSRHLRTAARGAWGLKIRKDFDFDLPDVVTVSWRMRVDNDVNNYPWTDDSRGTRFALLGAFDVKTTDERTGGIGIVKYSDGTIAAHCPSGSGSLPQVRLGEWSEYRMEFDFAAGRYSSYKDGVKFCDRPSWTVGNLSDRWNPWAEPSGILFTSEGTGSTVTRFDDIVISRGSGPSPPAVVTTANRPPVLVPVGLQTAASGERVSFAVIATDADNDPVTVRAQTLPAGASFDGRVFAWTTPTSFTGEWVVAFIASDDDPTSADAEMAVRISVVAGATHRLTVSRQGEGRIWSLPGGIDCGADCTHTYDENAIVTLRAVPAAEHRFAGWTGCTADVSDSTSCTVAMTASIQVAARFSSDSTDTPPPAPETLYSEGFESQGEGSMPEGYVTVFNGRGDAEQRVEEEGGSRHLRTAARGAWSLKIRKDFDFDLPDVVTVSWRMRVDNDVNNYPWTDDSRGTRFALLGAFDVKTTDERTGGIGIVKYSDGTIAAHCPSGSGSLPQVRLGEWSEYRMEFDFAAGRYSSYKDGVKFCDRPSWTVGNLSDRWNPWAEPSGILFTSEGTGSTVTRFDDIVISRGSGPSPPAVGGQEDPSREPGSGTGSETDSGTGPQSDRHALEALYDATGGPGWKNSTNWKTDAPLSDWHGVSTDGYGRVYSLDLYDNGLSGAIPRQLGDLPNLHYLVLADNQLSGPIPSWMGTLTKLRSLYLQGNDLGGPIPHQLGNLTNLEHLDLARTGLTGPIPRELGNLTNLRLLWLWSNQLSGPIPPELGNLASLEVLWLWSNQLSGPIPPELGNLASLETLNLDLNQLSGPIPPELGNLASLETLRLDLNQLSGKIPHQLGSLMNLEILDLSFNKLNGMIPPELGNLASLTRLSLSGNQLSGKIPHQLGSLMNLEGLSLSLNELNGMIPFELGNLASLVGLRLKGNQLSGKIPHQLGNLMNLKGLDLSSNELNGMIPFELGNLASLERLELNGNQLSGPIPPELGNLASLESLDLGGNQLSGPIPPELGNLASLTRLDLRGNQLSGPIPPELGNLASLVWLDLRGNQLSGPLPSSMLNLLGSLYVGRDSGLCAPSTTEFQEWLREKSTDIRACGSSEPVSPNTESQACTDGLVVRPGEQCEWTIYGTTGVLEVHEGGRICLESGAARRCFRTLGTVLQAAREGGATVRGNDDGSWTIDGVTVRVDRHGNWTIVDLP